MPMIEFCDKNDIDWFPINLKISNGQKILLPINDESYKRTTKDGKISYVPSYDDFNQEKINKKNIKEKQKLVDKYEYIAIDTHKIQQLDCDNEETKDYFMKFFEIKYRPYFLSVNKKLPHIFVRFSRKYEHENPLLQKKNHRITPTDDSNLDYDLLCGQWSYVRKDAIVYNTNVKQLMIENDTSKILFKECFNKLNGEKKEAKKEAKKEVKKNEEEKEEEKTYSKDDMKEYVKENIKEYMKEKKEKVKQIKDKKEKETQEQNKKKTKEILNKIINKDDLNEKQKELINYLECLSKERFESYDSWLKLTTIVKSNYENYYDIYDNFCSKYKGYKKQQNDNYWKSLKSEKISMGTLLFWCKEDNYNKYSQIILDKYKDLSISDKFCCEILSLINNNIIWKDGILYYYDGKIWRTGEYAKLKFKGFIDEELYNHINLHILSCYVKSQDIKKLITQLNRIQTQKGKNEIIETSKQHEFGFNKDDDENVIFNKDWNLFPMKSRVYNLETEQYEEYTREMYITANCGYDYFESKKEDEIKEQKQKDEEFNNLLNKIFVNPEIKNKFLMICSTGLENRLTQKIHFLTGCGGNGKSLLCDYLNTVFGNFYKSADTEIITLNGKKDDVKIAEIANKRIVMFPEPDKTQKINAGVMRKITGEKKLNARFLYENGTEKKNVGTFIVCCNSMPTLSAEPEIADQRRFEIIPFQSLFTQEEHLINEKENIFKADISLLEKQEYYKISFLKQLFVAHKEYKKNGYKYNIIQEGEQLKKKYFEKAMTLINFLNEYFDMTEDEDDIISFKKIYDFFKDCEMTKQLSKEERRRYNRNGFEEYFESNIYYKSRYIKKHTSLNKAVLIKLKPKNGYEEFFDKNDD